MCAAVTACECEHCIVVFSEQFVTTNGNKCQLGEAYEYIFQRPAVAHDACDDAKMTMELYHHWKRCDCHSVYKEFGVTRYL